VFFVSSKEHMTREKRKRAVQQPSSMKDRRVEHPTAKIGSPHAARGQEEENKALSPRSSRPPAAIAEHSAMDIDSNPAAYDEEKSIDPEDYREEKMEVTLAVEEFGQHFIAPRTLKRLGAGAPTATAGVNGDESSTYDSSPPIDLTTTQLQPGDRLAYRITELSSDWTPVVSAWKVMTVSQHADGNIIGRADNSDEDLTLPNRDLLSPRLLSGPSFTGAQQRQRESERAKKKQAKWMQKHQENGTTEAVAAAPQSSSSSSRAKKAVPMIRGSNRFTLMSNIVRALQEKQKNTQQALPQEPSQGVVRQMNTATPAKAGSKPAEKQLAPAAPAATQMFHLPTTSTPAPRPTATPVASPSPSASTPALARDPQPKTLREQAATWSSKQVAVFLRTITLEQAAKVAEVRGILGASLLGLSTAADVSSLFGAELSAASCKLVVDATAILRGEPNQKVAAAVQPPRPAAPAATPAPSVSELEQLLQRKRQELQATNKAATPA
jgi:hypothetical protein